MPTTTPTPSNATASVAISQGFRVIVRISCVDLQLFLGIQGGLDARPHMLALGVAGVAGGN